MIPDLPQPAGFEGKKNSTGVFCLWRKVSSGFQKESYLSAAKYTLP